MYLPSVTCQHGKIGQLEQKHRSLHQWLYEYLAPEKNPFYDRMMTTQCNEKEDKQSEEIWRKSSLGASPTTAVMQKVIHYHEGQHSYEYVISTRSSIYLRILPRIRLKGISKLHLRI